MKKTLLLIVSVVIALIANITTIQAQSASELDAKQQKIVTIAATTAIGNLGTLASELEAGLEAGLTVNQIKEILVQMYAYAGFPRSLQGINTFMTVLDERTARGINDPQGRDASPITDTRDKYTRGREILETLSRRDETQISGANAFAPAIDTFLKEHLFADIFERDVLTHSQRELATVAALAAIPGVTPMMQFHMNAALNVGVTPEQLKELTGIISSVINSEQGVVAAQTLEKVLESRNQ